MERVVAAVATTLADLSVLLAAAETADIMIRPFVRANLDLQIHDLQVLERHMRKGLLTRRMWSFGQAAVPVLGVLLNSVDKSANGRLNEPLRRCRHSLDDLGASLVRFAEGR